MTLGNPYASQQSQKRAYFFESPRDEWARGYRSKTKRLTPRMVPTWNFSGHWSFHKAVLGVTVINARKRPGGRSYNFPASKTSRSAASGYPNLWIYRAVELGWKPSRPSTSSEPASPSYNRWITVYCGTASQSLQSSLLSTHGRNLWYLSSEKIETQLFEIGVYDETLHARSGPGPTLKRITVKPKTSRRGLRQQVGGFPDDGQTKGFWEGRGILLRGIYWIFYQCRSLAESHLDEEFFTSFFDSTGLETPTP
ncbi:hypothetical protein BGW80DRAFT_1254445 [Lactifluus volemus]|nr:hypothetical protein BGW80DRAFT_1254445 [Lactifluus volemus]